MGELIAGIVSHPPGLARCETSGACGPPGLIVSARTSEGAVANVLAIDAGGVDSGLAQANVVADAVAGQGVFRKAGRQTHIRAIANLFPETVQLVVSAGSHIAKSPISAASAFRWAPMARAPAWWRARSLPPTGSR